MIWLVPIIQAATAENIEVHSILERMLNTATAVGEAVKDEVNAKDTELTFHVKELLQWVAAFINYFHITAIMPLISFLERISKPVVAQLKRGRVMKVIMKSSSAEAINKAREELEKCLQVLSVHRRSLFSLVLT